MSNTPTLMNNVDKLVFLASTYKGKQVNKLRELFQWPLIDFQGAVWKAEEMGYLKITKKKKGVDIFEVVKTPGVYVFGERVEELELTINAAFEGLERRERHLAEAELNNWLSGYPVQDQLVAMNHMLAIGTLEDYTITTKTMDKDTETYTYYCIAGGKENRYARNDFIDKKKIVAYGETK